MKEHLHKEIDLKDPVVHSSRTAQRWLNSLGLKFGRYCKGIYNDGHERDDVVQYRNEFLERMLFYEKRMTQYEGDFMETEIGANADGYWKNSDLIAQVQNQAIPIFKVLHPGCQGLFVFDNFQSHHARPPDALHVNLLNLNDGGRAVNMRPGWFASDSGPRCQ
jgi:hypothetical protein